MIQYIADKAGHTTAVQIQIPIDQWEDIRKKYEGIESEFTDVPNWQQEMILQRKAYYEQHPEKLIPLDDFLKKLDEDEDEI